MANLLLFMTPGNGINTWLEVGSLNREMKPYMQYVKKGWSVKILSFDKSAVTNLPEGIEVIYFPSRRSLWMLPWLCRKLGKWADVIKTNQSVHAYFYTVATKFWKKPILLRCGYVQGAYREVMEGLTLKTRIYQALEAKAFRDASYCEVPTLELAQWVQKRYRVPRDKISVVPNFVDTDIFKPAEKVKKNDKSVISVGRLHPVKRFDVLIKACSEIPGCVLTIVGEGPERLNLRSLGEKLKIKLNLPGNIAHEKLPEMISQHKIFAMTSEWEGHPKALIEAMACGIPCLAVLLEGIQNILTHGENGWIVNSSANDIRDGLKTLFGNVALRDALSVKGHDFAVTNYEFPHVIAKEFEIMEKLLKTL